MKHELKTWPDMFQQLLAGTKTFEARKNDRGYHAGDELFLREWQPGATRWEGSYTGRSAKFKVTHILYGTEGGEKFGVQEGFCVMSIKPMERTKPHEKQKAKKSASRGRVAAQAI